MANSQLTLELMDAVRDDRVGNGEPFLYQVNGMPPGYSAQVGNTSGFAWRYRFGLNGRLCDWSGDYQSPDEVLEDLGDLCHLLRRMGI